MSEQSQGPGWWQASDGKWYPPQDPPTLPGNAGSAPGGATPPGATPGVAAGAESGSGGSGGNRKGLFVGLGILVVVLLIALVAVVVTGGDDDDVASDGPSTSAAEDDEGDDESGDGGDGDGDDDQGDADISDEMPSEDITLADDVVVVDSESGDLFGGYSDDGEALMIDSSAEGLDELEEGDVLLLSGITVVRVAQLDEVDDGVIVTGEPVTLPEVIVDGELEWEDLEFDPDEMRLFVYEDSTPGGSQANNIPGAMGFGGAPGPSFSPASFALPSTTVSGKVGDFSFDLSHEGADGGHHLALDLTSSGDMVGTINVDVKTGSLATSGKIQIAGQEVQAMDYGFGEFGGDATITTDLRATKNTTSIMSKPFLKVPFGIEFPALVGGIPFTLSIKSTIQVQLSMALAGASLGGTAEISFGGDAGFHFKGGSLTVSGNRVQDAPDLINTIKGMATGPVGVVVTSELPKVGFGFGFLQTGAGVFISSGMVVQQSILPPPPACTGSQIAYVLAAGVEANFLGKSIDLGRKAIVDKRWDYTVPRTEQCMAVK